MASQPLPLGQPDLRTVALGGRLGVSCLIPLVLALQIAPE